MTTTNSLSQILAEKAYPISELAKDESINITTVWRWWKKGVRGIRLETYLRGSTRMTSREAVERFKVATTEAGTQPDAKTATPTAARSRKRPANRANDQANRILDAAGINR